MIAMRILVLAGLAYGALVGPAFAYVDPGILAVLYQLVYALVFGAAFAFILRPWRWLKGLFSRRDTQAPPCAPRAGADDDPKP